MKYILTATLPEQVETMVLDEDNDQNAVFHAIHTVMTKAFAERTGPWAMGEVTLTDEQGNSIMRPMPAKIAEEA
jgi:hypothetical protein